MNSISYQVLLYKKGEIDPIKHIKCWDIIIMKYCCYNLKGDVRTETFKVSMNNTKI